MSQDYCFTVQRSTLPHPRDWARTLREQGFPYRLATAFDPACDAGYVACGRHTGFEYFSAPLTPETREELPAVSSAQDWILTLCCQGDAERAAAAAALAALAQLTFGWTHEMESGSVFLPEHMLLYARAMVKSHGPARRTDHVAPALKAIMLPVLEAHGFARETKGVFCRLREGIHQTARFFPFLKHPGFFGLQLHAYCLAATGLQSTATVHYRITPKEWLPTMGMWDASTPERATVSMRAVRDEFLDSGLAYFERMGTLEGLAQHLPNHNHLGAAHRACVLLSAGRVSEGVAQLLHARALFLARTAAEADGPVAGRWSPHLAAVQQLLDAADSGNHAELLDRWAAQALADLKIEPNTA